MTDEVRGGFLHRWSRRKVQARQGQRIEDEPLQEGDASDGVSADTAPARQVEPSQGVHTASSIASVSGAGETMAVGSRASGPGATEPPGSGRPDASSDASSAQAAPAPLTLDDVRALSPDSDFAPFVSQHVDPQVRNAALKKLFADPHYNVMDGLDVYIDDYSQLEPLPAPMLRRMASAHALKMFDGLLEEGDAGSQVQAGGSDQAAQTQKPDANAPAGALVPPQDTELPNPDISSSHPARGVG